MGWGLRWRDRLVYSTAMNHSHIIDQLGGPAQLARAIGQTPQAVRQWKSRGRIPSQHWPAVIQAALSKDVPVTYKQLAESQAA